MLHSAVCHRSNLHAEHSGDFFVFTWGYEFDARWRIVGVSHACGQVSRGIDDHGQDVALHQTRVGGRHQGRDGRRVW